MNAHRITRRTFTGLVLALFTGVALSAPMGPPDPPGPPGPPGPPPGPPGLDARYQVQKLVADVDGVAAHTDAKLVNPWGIVFNPFGFVWISDNHSGFSTLYDGAGVLNPLVVAIPNAAGATSSNPTGIVFNAAPGFVVSKTQSPPCSATPCPTLSGTAAFMFVTEDGVLAGWNPTVDRNNAVLIKDNSGSGTIYKGLAIGAGGNGSLLYATDFHNNKIDVWNNAFAPVTLPAGAFKDPAIPTGFAPFGIQAINGNIYVTFAKQDPGAEDDVAGKGLGYVDVFDPNGNLLDRVVSKGPLNAPWGLTLAPAGFGGLSGSLLVGNFGDGLINAFDIVTGQHLGALRDANGHTIVIEGLWGLAFGNGFQGQSVNTLFFTAGPGDELHGLYGRIDAVLSGNSGPGPSR